MSTFIAEFIDGGPRCMRDDCMIQHNGAGQQTLGHFPPTYDNQGNNINPDMNITTQPMRCLSCGKSWVERWQNGIRISVE